MYTRMYIYKGNNFMAKISAILQGLKVWGNADMCNIKNSLSLNLIKL